MDVKKGPPFTIFGTVTLQNFYFRISFEYFVMSLRFLSLDIAPTLTVPGLLNMYQKCVNNLLFLITL